MNRAHPFPFDGAAEVATLRRVFTRAFAASAVLLECAGCGGRIEADTPTVDDGGNAANLPDASPPPTKDAVVDASTTHEQDATGVTVHPPATCASTPWTFPCDARNADAGPRPKPDASAVDALPACHTFTRAECEAECFGPRAVSICGRTPADQEAEYLQCYVEPTTATTRTVQCQYALPGGRRPEGYATLGGDGAGGGASEIGVVLARLAHLEAASVDAFLVLRDELRAHDAPDALVRAAEGSADDERRHARAVAAFAREHAAPSPASLATVTARGPARTLYAMALENAVEGCVRETFGALVALWQSNAAVDPRLRRAMASIADDELRHAALAWQVHAWAETRLTADENARVRRAKLEAEAALDREIAAAPPSPALAWLGVPSSREAQVLRQSYAEAMLS